LGVLDTATITPEQQAGAQAGDALRVWVCVRIMRTLKKIFWNIYIYIYIPIRWMT
jgi:hypothetical protein